MKRYLISLLLPLSTFAQIQVNDALSKIYQLPANGQIVGKIKLKNAGKKPETFVASKSEIIFECGFYGAFTDVKTHDRSLNKWLEFDVDEQTLSPNQEYDLVFRINIPDDAASGTYWSAVMIEYGDPYKATQAIAVEQKPRYAVQIIVNKGTIEAPKLTYKQVRIISKSKNSKTVMVELENTGFYSVYLKTQLELYNENGTKIQTIKGENKNIYPNRCNIFNIEVDNLASGKYDGIILSDTGKKIFGSNITLKID